MVGSHPDEGLSGGGCGHHGVGECWLLFSFLGTVESNATLSVRTLNTQLSPTPAPCPVLQQTPMAMAVAVLAGRNSAPPLTYAHSTPSSPPPLRPALSSNRPRRRHCRAGWRQEDAVRHGDRACWHRLGHLSQAIRAAACWRLAAMRRTCAPPPSWTAP